MKRAILLGLSFLITTAWVNAGAKKKGGFDVSNAIIPVNRILSGGPPKDGIPSIEDPQFVSAAEAGFLLPRDLVISFTVGEETRAYPFRILNYHEIVNDTIGETHFAVTFCPLCNSAMVFNREISGRPTTFGVSGLLYNSDVLMYDRETESLWSQLATEAIAGERVGTRLEWLPSETLLFASWRKKYPDGKVLSTTTGHYRNYNQSPYRDYLGSSGTLFPVPFKRREFEKKDLVFGISANGRAKAYPPDSLPRDQIIRDSLGDASLKLYLASDSIQVRVWNEKTGEEIPVVTAFWFAWQAFYPETEIWVPSE